MATPAIDQDFARALAASHLRNVPPDLINELLSDAVRLRVPAGAMIRYEGQPGPHVELVIDGLIRVYLSAPDGRTLTIRYGRRGALLGTLSLFLHGYSMPGGNQALVDSQLLTFRPGVVLGLVDRELPVARALLDDLSERVYWSVQEVRDRAFATVRQRVARHLLDLASEHQHGPELLAPVAQRELADAVGTAREVVVRTLRELREEGIVQTGRHGIAITAPERLAGELFPGTRPTGVSRPGT
jgi:CRP/FNR family cyclic AMP-dependent transcriptional regulator